MKRYVMTKDKTIYDTLKMPTINFDLDTSVDKESDNLLDLLEVGDLVEILSTGNGDYYVLEVQLINNNVLETSHIYITRGQAEGFSYNNYGEKIPFIKAIWKRNGDVMRRFAL